MADQTTPTPEEIAAGQRWREQAVEVIAAALRSYGDRRAREMQARAAAIVRAGKGCYWPDHVQDGCGCKEIAAAIEALPLTPPAPDGGTDTQTKE